jgi:hypothetical protein
VTHYFGLTFTILPFTPINLLVDRYRLRWQIYAALIYYVLTHLVTLKAMPATGRPFEDFSLLYCWEGIRQVLPQIDQLIYHGVTSDRG